MSWASRLLGVLAETSIISVHEDPSLLTIELTEIQKSAWDSLQDLRSEQSEHHVTLRLGDTHSGDGHNLLEDDFEDTFSSGIRLFCAKVGIQDTARFFYLHQWVEYVGNRPESVESCKRVLLGDIDQPLFTRGLEIRPWESETSTGIELSRMKTPRELVNDSTGTGIVPASILVWLPLSWPSDEVDELFGKVSARRLALSLATSIFKDSNGDLSALADIKRKVSGPIEGPGELVWLHHDLKEKVYSAAAWVYSDGTDNENRHAILSSEIARSFPKGKGWGAGLDASLDGALESAKIAYKLHLYDKSVDALKLMSDLRKSLADDIKAVGAQTSALAAGLWKDATVMLGAVAIKAFGSTLTFWVLVLTALYLAASCYLNKRVAERAVTAIQTNEKIFRKKLYSPILANDEYDELAGNRYKEIIADFDNFKKLVAGVYYFASALFVALALWPHWNNIHEFASCSQNHFAQYIGRLFMPDARPFFPFPCHLS